MANAIAIQEIPLIWDCVSLCFFLPMMKKNFVSFKNVRIFAPAFETKKHRFGLLAQLVQSASFTRKRSRVRISHRPQKKPPNYGGIFLFSKHFLSLIHLCRDVYTKGAAAHAGTAMGAFAGVVWKGVVLGFQVVVHAVGLGFVE